MQTGVAAAPSKAGVAGAIPARATRAFAARPDDGLLLHYGDARETIRRGPYTWRPVELSEEHALRAIGGAPMVVTSPDGLPIVMHHVRHIEHEDGNWTWIGRTDSGEDTVITFGEKAAFGVIPNGPDTLRLVSRGGRAWLVQSDRARIGQGEDMVHGRGRTDFRIAPSDAAMPGEHVSAAATAQAATAGAQTVDMLVGYTPGFADAQGGDSQAVTRITYLVDLTNSIYANSQITMRMRLVHTMRVSYVDATDNDDALGKLTGWVNNQSAPVDPAFNALRAARETYGADLVSLVRDFRTPEQGGCGIAWLLGADTSGINDSDAAFGYSVVSDGTDLNEADGSNYFCRDESFAHEAGHNMGQAHNIEDSSGAGAHSYSYGYREASTSGFYTVMSYRLANSSQFGIRYMANPNVLYQGRATGVANSADNVRSMQLTMPIVAGFRASTDVRRVPNDANGDGKSDLVFWNATNGTLAYWAMNGASITSFYNQALGTAYAPATLGHSTLGPRSDILMRRTTDRVLFSYQSQASGFVPMQVGGYDPNWTIIGQGDINGDGYDDIFWRNIGTGQFAYWLMQGPVYIGGQSYNTPVSYVISAITDLDGDGDVDIVWADPGSRYMSVWLSVGAGSGFTVQQIGQYGADWRLIGAADVTGDGKSDLLWRNTANTFFSWWRMDGAVYQGAGSQPTPTNYTLDAIGDYNGDGISDLLWETPDRTMTMWAGNGASFYGYLIGQRGADWAIQR